MAHSLPESLNNYVCLSYRVRRRKDNLALIEGLGEDELGKAEYYCRKIIRSRIISVKRVRDFLEAKCSNGDNDILCGEFLEALLSIGNEKLNSLHSYSSSFKVENGSKWLNLSRRLSSMLRSRLRVNG